jgi:hypothetical protein
MPDLDLPTLGPSFARVRRRWARQGRRVRQLASEADKIATDRDVGRLRGARRQVAALETAREEVGYHQAWARWSATGDEVADLVATILRRPARTLRDLAIKFDALAWLLLGDSAVVDHEAERQVRAFGRELRKLTAGGLVRPSGRF